MSVGWSGPDPTQAAEAPGTDYELATRYTTSSDINITAVRVWHGLNSGNVSRAGRVWSTGGSLLASVGMTNTLSSGWTEFDLASPLFVAAGTTFDVSYNTVEYYGAVAGGYPRASADTLLSATAGRLNVTPGSFPDTPVATFYGIDVVYELAGNLPPEITSVSAVADGLDATATVTLTDETPAAVVLRWDWGDGDRTVTAAGVLTDDHTYAAAGHYAIAVQATDDGELTDFAATPVVVRDDAGLFDLDDAVGELATRLSTITGLRVHRYGPDAKRINPPAAIVALPAEPINYHETYDTGGPAASATVPIVVVVGKVHSRSAYQALAEYMGSGGARSIRSTVESGVFTAFDGVTVKDAVADEYTIAGDTYLVAIFSTVIMR